MVILRILNDEASQLFKLLIEGSDKRHANDLEEGVHESNSPSVDSQIRKCKVNEGIERIEDNGNEHDADYVKGEVYYCRTLTVLVCAERGKHSGYASTDVLTHYDWDSRAKADSAGRSERLKNTDGCGGGLNDGGKHETCDNTEDGILKHGEKLSERLVASEGANRIGHHSHTGHKHYEAEENNADVLLLAALNEHNKTNTDNRNDGHPGVGLKYAEQLNRLRTGIATETVKSGEPSGDGSTYVCTHDNADRLKKRHRTGVYKAYDHNRGRR